jgi:hypothetical protein
VTVWLISALERLPQRGRRFVVLVVALLLIGVALKALTFAPSPDGRVRPRGPAARVPAVKRSPRPAPPRPPTPVPATQLRRARDAAERFLATYLPFAYGRARALAVRPVTPGLRRELVGSVLRSRRPSTAATRGFCPCGWSG